MLKKTFLYITYSLIFLLVTLYSPDLIYSKNYKPINNVILTNPVKNNQSVNKDSENDGRPYDARTPNRQRRGGRRRRRQRRNRTDARVLPRLLAIKEDPLTQPFSHIKKIDIRVSKKEHKQQQRARMFKNRRLISHRRIY